MSSSCGLQRTAAAPKDFAHRNAAPQRNVRHHPVPALDGGYGAPNRRVPRARSQPRASPPHPHNAPMTTAYHAQYWAHALTVQSPPDGPPSAALLERMRLFDKLTSGSRR